MSNASFAEQVARYTAEHGINRYAMSHRSMRKIDARLTRDENMQRNRLPDDKLPRRDTQTSM